MNQRLPALSLLLPVLACADVQAARVAETPGPLTLRLHSGGAQAGTVGERLPAEVVVQVLDVAGDPIPDVAVKFSAPPGAGSVNATSGRTNRLGLARTAWALGPSAGGQRLLVELTDRGERQGAGLLEVSAHALPAAPARLEAAASSGPGELRGVPGAILPAPIVVRVTDRFGNPVPGAAVEFATVEGGAAAGAPPALTDGTGSARISWQLGPSPGPQVMRVSVRGLAAVDLVATADWSLGDQPPLVLPPAVFVVEGTEAVVYFDNTLPFADAAAFSWDVPPPAPGQAVGLAWRSTEAGPAAQGRLTLAMYDKATGNLAGSATAVVKTIPASSGAGQTPRVLLLGDSLTATGAIGYHLLALAGRDEMKVELVGTRGNPPNVHEGRSGWKVLNYTTDYVDAGGPNPFWSADAGGLDFDAYLRRGSLPAPDWVLVLLGINDVLLAKTDVEVDAIVAASFDGLDALITSIRAASPATRVGLMTPPPPSASEAAFAVYGSKQTRARYKRNILRWDASLISRYQGREAEKLYVVPTHTAIDTATCMADALHPLHAGYAQLAGATWGFLKANAR